MMNRLRLFLPRNFASHGLKGKVWSYESEVTQPCLTLCDPMDCSLPGSSVPGIFQARVLEWVAIAFSSCVFLTPSKRIVEVAKRGRKERTR